MPVPEITSAEALDGYVAGEKIAASKGPAWRDVQLSVFSLPPDAEVFTMPAVTEPFIVWISSGEAEAQEREDNGPWVTSHPEKGLVVPHCCGRALRVPVENSHSRAV
jgi:AraC family transcriptional regulator